VDHVVGGVGDPDVGIPVDGFGASTLAFGIGECRDKDQVLGCCVESRPKGCLPVSGHVPPGGCGIDEEQPAALPIIGNYIGEGGFRVWVDADLVETLPMRFQSSLQYAYGVRVSWDEVGYDFVNELAAGRGHGDH
jgi:hypothetical protein